MNLHDTLFMSSALGAGVGLGICSARHHGIVGFILGFAGGIATIFILLGVVTLLLPKKTVFSRHEKNIIIRDKDSKTEQDRF